MSITSRDVLNIEVLRAIESPYQFANTEKTQIVNHFRMHLTNQGNEDLKITELRVLNESINVVAPQLTQTLGPGESGWVHIFLTFPSMRVTDGLLNVEYEIEYTIDEAQVLTGTLNLLAPNL